jgi:hypothetical protein
MEGWFAGQGGTGVAVFLDLHSADKAQGNRMNAIEMKDDTSRGVWRSIFLPLVGEDAPNFGKSAGEGVAVQHETGLEQAQSPLSCPCRGTLSHKGRGKASACLCFTMTNIFMRLPGIKRNFRPTRYFYSSFTIN